MKNKYNHTLVDFFLLRVISIVALILPHGSWGRWCLSLIVFVGGSCTAHAGVNDDIEFSIPRSTAGVALKAYVQQAKRQVLFPYDLVQAYEANPVKGRFTADQALALLLEGTGLEAVVVEKDQLLVRVSADSQEGFELNTRNKKVTGLFALITGLISGGGATAQGVGSVALEEVVVTAQKREQNLQDTPISISAFDSQALEDQGISDIGDVSQYTPNVQITPPPGGSTGVTIAMRGSVTVNPVVTIDTNVGVYMDGVFIAKNVGGLFDVAELERIEILRGPQGTLYGKNTVGGAVNLISRKPGGEMGGKARLGVGNYGYTDVFASFDTDKLADKVSLNAAFSKRDRDGFYDNNSAVAKVDEFKVLDSFAARFAMLYDVSDNMDVYYTFDMNKKENTPSYGQTGGEPDRRIDEGNSDGADVDHAESFGHALQVTFDLSDNVTLKSITAYREMEFDDINDYDGGDSPLFLLHAERHADQEQFSQEFQLIGDTDSLNYVLGLFYFNEDVSVENPLTQAIAQFTIPLYTRRNAYGAESTSIAAYGQVDWTINELVTVTAGARWTDEEKEGFVDHPDNVFYGNDSYSASPDDSWTNFSPMAIVTLNWTDDISNYFKLAQGWKSGGFNAEAPNEESALRSYDEESVTSFELGLKSRWLNNRLQANAAIFYNEIEDLQLSEVDPATFYSEIFNAGESTITGLELEMLFAITSRLTLNFNYGYLDGEYDKFLARGMDIKDEAKFPYTPEDTASMGLSYVADISIAQLSARLDWSYVGEHVVYHDAAQADVTRIEEYALINARVGLSNILGSSVNLSLWGKNLTDEEYRNNGIPLGGPLAVNYFGDPRTYGVDVTYEF
jgi:iron complex outermembrane recepter protein